MIRIDLHAIAAACVLAVMSLLAGAGVFAEQGSDSLAQRYREAHEAGDLQALEALVNWEGATERTRDMIESRLRRFLGRPIRSIEMRAATGSEQFASQRFRPNLKPVGWLVISFEPTADDAWSRGLVFVVGEQDGERLITVAVPSPRG